MYQIQISAVTNGYIVKVGCRTVVFNSRENLLEELEEYLKNPDDVEKTYLELEKEFNPGKTIRDASNCDQPCETTEPERG